MASTKNLPLISYLTNKVDGAVREYEIADKTARQRLDELEEKIDSSTTESGSKKTASLVTKDGEKYPIQLATKFNTKSYSLQKKNPKDNAISILVEKGAEMLKSGEYKLCILKKKHTARRGYVYSRYEDKSPESTDRYITISFRTSTSNTNPKTIKKLKQNEVDETSFYGSLPDGYHTTRLLVSTVDLLQYGDDEGRSYRFEPRARGRYYHKCGLALYDENDQRVSNIIYFKIETSRSTREGGWETRRIISL